MEFKNKFGYFDISKRLTDYVNQGTLNGLHFPGDALIRLNAIQDCIDDMKKYATEQYKKQEKERKKRNLTGAE